MRALLIDLDGVIYQHEAPIPGALDTLAWVRAQAIPHAFVTNTTSAPRRAHTARGLVQIKTETALNDNWPRHCPLVRGSMLPAWDEA
jgi:ribonucleotide monophosphatase NagD (HAD superfamily)